MDSLERLKDLAISDRGFVFDPHTGATYSLNPTGLLVLRGLRDGRSREQIAGAVREAYEVNGADLLRDVDEFDAVAHAAVGVLTDQRRRSTRVASVTSVRWASDTTPSFA